jgi:hypothetical protein
LEQEYEKLFEENEQDPILRLGMKSGNTRKAKDPPELIERCGVKIPMLDLNEINVAKEIGS